MSSAVNRLFALFDRWATAAVGPRLNPFAHLGALGLTSIIIALITGVALLPFYAISMHAAYASVAQMLGEMRWSAGLIHSIHRYTADAAMFFSVLHLLKIYGNRAFKGGRTLSWETGLLAIGMVGLALSPWIAARIRHADLD